MKQRIVRVTAAAAVAVVPLLAGCGAGHAGSADPTAPASSPAGAPSTAPAAATPTVAPSVVDPSAVDPAQQTEQVQAATETFVRTVLTVGYPDRTFDDYTDRIEPLMTPAGFASLESADSIERGSAALKSLHEQRARSAPTFSDDPEVTSLDATSATARLAYENVAQQKAGDDWKTLKSLGRGSVTVRLVLDDGKWLVDDAS